MFDEFGPIDTDTHITEPPDVWTARVSKKWGNAVPHIRRVEGMDMWFVRDQVIHAPGWVTMAGFDGSYPEHPQGFDDKLYQLHLEVMTTLAEMLARDCRTGHCEVCHGSCVKPALPDVSLSAAELRGASLHQYLKTLDKLGLPGEVTLAWISQLPV